jgi:hypothetical protein
VQGRKNEGTEKSLYRCSSGEKEDGVDEVLLLLRTVVFQFYNCTASFLMAAG